jgi:hypothetical protein
MGREIKDTSGGEEEDEEEESGEDSIDEDEEERKLMICRREEAEVTPDDEETSIEILRCKENAGGFKPVIKEIMKQKTLLTDNPSSMFVILPFKYDSHLDCRRI